MSGHSLGGGRPYKWTFGDHDVQLVHAADVNIWWPYIPNTCVDAVRWCATELILPVMLWTRGLRALKRSKEANKLWPQGSYWMHEEHWLGTTGDNVLRQAPNCDCFTASATPSRWTYSRWVNNAGYWKWEGWRETACDIITALFPPGSRATLNHPWNTRTFSGGSEGCR